MAENDRDGGVIGWALRWVLLCCAIALVSTGIVKLGPAVLLDRAAQPEPALRAADIGPADNTLVYPANEHGHVILEAAVNGASVRLLVDTGASLVTLTPPMRAPPASRRASSCSTTGSAPPTARRGWRR